MGLTSRETPESHSPLRKALIQSGGNLVQPVSGHKCGGKRIGCRQIEDRIQGLECVIEAAVIGVADEVLGEAVQAFVCRG